ncbi:MAG: glutaredoxin family protein [Planctomycetes bacterium]|nr:glutaredoxin family protein [Planctomycetota bacterium]
MALASFVAGCALLRNRQRPSLDWAPTRPGVRFARIVLYTRRGCHLCDDARRLLERYRRWLPAVEAVDIDEHPELTTLYGECVPVVEFDGRERFRGRVNEMLLRRLIEGTPAARADSVTGADRRE